MTLSICAVTGFGTIITTSDTFQMVLDFLSGLNAHPVIICWVVIALLAFLVGGCSTCQIIGLPLIAPRLVEMGLPLSTIHRISTFASTNLDTMPYCGSVLMLLPVAHLKLNEAYPAMFITTVLSTTIGTVSYTHLDVYKRQLLAQLVSQLHAGVKQLQADTGSLAVIRLNENPKVLIRRKIHRRHPP